MLKCQVHFASFGVGDELFQEDIHHHQSSLSKGRGLCNAMKGAAQLPRNEIHLLSFMFTVNPRASGVLRSHRELFLGSAFVSILSVISGTETVRNYLPLIADQIFLVSSSLTPLMGILFPTSCNKFPEACNTRYQ